MTFKFYKHEVSCPKCNVVAHSLETPMEELSNKDKAWYLKHHNDFTHGTDKDREYYKRFETPKS